MAINILVDAHTDAILWDSVFYWPRPPVAQRKRETCPGLQVHMAATIKPSDVPDLLLQPFQQKNIQFPYRLFGKSAPVKTDRFRLCGSTEV